MFTEAGAPLPSPQSITALYLPAGKVALVSVAGLFAVAKHDAPGRFPLLPKSACPRRSTDGIIEHHLDRILFNPGGVGVVAGQSVPVGDEKVRVVTVLQLNPIGERAHVIAEVQFSGGTHAAQHARFGGSCGHWRINTPVKTWMTGLKMAPRKRPPTAKSNTSAKMPMRS